MDRKPVPAEVDARSEVVPPWVETLTRVLDDAVVIPGTKLRFGADAIIGFLLPTAGDAMTGATAVLVLFAAWRARVPTVVLSRMVMNIGIDALVGAVPIVGDAFDVVWKSNRANVKLLKEHAQGAPREARLADYLLVSLGVGLALAIVALPIIVLAVVLAHVAR